MYPPNWVPLHYTADMAVGCFKVTVDVVYNCAIPACSETHWNKTNMSGSSDSEEFYDAEDLTPNRSSRWNVAMTVCMLISYRCVQFTYDIIWVGGQTARSCLFVNIMCCTYNT